MLTDTTYGALGKVLRALETHDCRPRGSALRGYSALCPAHPDTSPSLSVGVGRQEQVLLFCHAGCSPTAVLDALALEWADLFNEPRG